MLWSAAYALDRTMRPRPDQLASNREDDARRAIGRLIRLGGRPSRSIRRDPTWDATVDDDGYYHWYDEKRKTRCCVASEDYLSAHFSDERDQFEGELKCWQQFREQQALPPDHPSLQTRDLMRPAKQDLVHRGYEEPLLDHLIKITDWRAYRSFRQSRRDAAANNRLLFKNMISQIHNELSKTTVQAYSLKNELEEWQEHLMSLQCDFDDEENSIEWIDVRMEQVLFEAVTTLEDNPSLLFQLEAKLLEDIQYLIQNLENYTEISCWQVPAPPADGDLTDRLIQLGECP